MTMITLPNGRFANSDDEAKKRREELRKKLLEGQSIGLKKGGEVAGDDDKDATLKINPGKLADALDDALRNARQQQTNVPPADPFEKRRKELRDRIKAGGDIYVRKDGSLGTTEGVGVKIPEGTLAALQQWYERDPMLLEAEKAAMNRDFPQFTLTKLSDGRLAWVGDVSLKVMGNNSWRLMAVYQPNHPQQQMGSSVYVYLVEPSIESLIESLGWRPHHLLRDSNNRDYLCTTEAGYVKASYSQSTSANTVMRWAIKWLLCFELVLTGDMTPEEFDKPHGI